MPTVSIAILVLSISFTLGMIAAVKLDEGQFFMLPQDAWVCTGSVVVNKELPRQESCTQYSLNGKKP